MTSFVFNPFTSNFDSVLSVGSVIPSGTANTALYLNASKVLSSSSGFQYFDTLPGGSGSAEYGLGLTRTLARTIDVSTPSTALFQAALTDTDTFIASGNDGSSAFYAANYSLLVGGSANLNTDVVQLSYIGFAGTLNSSGTQTLRGSTDFSVAYVGASGTVNMGSISVPTDAGDININLYGGVFTAAAQVNVVAPSNPTQTVYGVYATANRGGAMTPNACYGGYLKGLSGTLNYGVYAEGTTAGVYSKGHFVPFTNNTYDLGTSALRIRKVWVVDADYSGAVSVAGTLTTTAGRKVKRTAVSDAGYTVLSTDEIIAYTALTAGRTATLPNATGNSGQIFTIKDETGSASLYNITIATGGGNIDGAGTYVMNLPYQSISLYSNGTNYFIV